MALATVIGVAAVLLAAGGSRAAGIAPPAPRPNPDPPAATPLVHGTSPAAPRGVSGFCGLLRTHLGRGSASGGLFVLDPVHQRVICNKAGGIARPLASNMKLFTTSTALTMFGPDDRLATRVFAVGDLGRNGVLHGSLYLKGAGDPSLGSPAFYDHFVGIGTNLFALTSQIKGAGIKRVTGRLIADDTIFDHVRGVADSGFATSPYIGPLSGLAYDSGYTDASATQFSSDPAKLAAAKLASSLRSAGVTISPQVAIGALPRNGGLRIAFVRSPTMTNLVNETDVESNNYFAEMLMKGIGAKFGGAGTTAAGASVVEKFASRHNSAVHAVDGSGLTRSNTSTPANVAHLLESMRDETDGDQFVSDLALAGHEGTVADRMRGTAADGHCRTKTGTLTGVSNLSGYCFNKSGRIMIFSILMTGVSSLSRAHLEQDRIAALVAGR